MSVIFTVGFVIAFSIYIQGFMDFGVFTLRNTFYIQFILGHMRLICETKVVYNANA